MRLTGVQLGASLAGKLSRDPVSTESAAGSTGTLIAGVVRPFRVRSGVVGVSVRAPASGPA